MKPSETPVCPRCNRNDDVRKIMDEPAASPVVAARDGYLLEGIVIRPDSANWYCGSCSEKFGSPRLHWGKFLTERKQ